MWSSGIFGKGSYSMWQSSSGLWSGIECSGFIYRECLPNISHNTCTVLHCTVLYWTVLYCTVLYCTVLYCTVLYCTALYCTVLYGNILTPSMIKVWMMNVKLLSVFRGLKRTFNSASRCQMIKGVNWQFFRGRPLGLRQAIIQQTLQW